ncbi:MAG: hypothetical protein ACLROI_08565 [Beduini sp.]|uniref:hypothetical protein n=1 Tax=Beduini sp. TaxID=1922300 RepID=UPI0011CC3697
MKKITYVYLLLCSFFIFYLSIQTYDAILTSQYSPNSISKEYSSLIISPNAEMSVSDLIGLFDDNKIECYRIITNVDTRQNVIYAHSKNWNYFRSIYLEKGEITDLDTNYIYDSHSKNKNNKIFNPVDNEQFILQSMQNIDFIDGEYQIYSGDIDGLKVSLQSHLDLTQFMLSSAEGETSIAWNLVLYMPLLCLSLIGLVFIIVYNISILYQSKKICLNKLEGRNSLQIFYRFVLKDIAIGIFLQFIIYVLLYFIFIKTSFNNTFKLIEIILLIELFFIALLLIFSSLIFIQIKTISVNELIKGKRQYKSFLYLNYISKLFLLILSVNTFSQFILLSVQYFDYQKIKQHNIEESSITYYFFSSKYPQMAERSTALYEDLYINNNIYTYASISSLSTDEIQYIEVTKNYLIEQHLVNYDFQFDDEKYYYFIDESIKNDKKIELSLNQYYFQPNFTICKYSQLDSENLFIADRPSLNGAFNKAKTVFICIPEEKQIESFRYFRFNGNMLEALNYIENLYIKYDLPKDFFTIKNVNTEVYHQQDEIFIREVKILLPIVGLLLAAIIIQEIQLCILDCKINGKKYFLEYIEGRSDLYIASRFILIQSILYVSFNVFANFVLACNPIIIIFLDVSYIILTGLVILFTQKIMRKGGFRDVY